MPTYEYGCSACGHQWEKEQRISENPVRKCPSCGKAKAQRLISGGNFILKGDGWYADLYHKPAAKKSTGEGKSEAGESKSAEAKSEAKADAPPKPDKPAKADKAKGKAA
ncbi:MAG: zinc ribbon domain-containing protein [Sandaracinaceae bacterium]|nr:zinc ribbon domain-containing protein [Sandaracinaceae bacterium]